MPLHDWTNLENWDGMHQVWLVELLRSIKSHLPPGYRAYLGTAPTVAIGVGERPDVSVLQWEGAKPPTPANGATNGNMSPDIEAAVAVSDALDPQTALFVEARGRLVAALELISPRNKDRPEARQSYTSRYAGYLINGVHLLLVDVHRRPLTFSFPDAIGQLLQVARPPLPSPCAAAYRIGDPSPEGGRFVGLWQRPLVPGESLPELPLPITLDFAVVVDLEGTYMRAAADAYLT